MKLRWVVQDTNPYLMYTLHWHQANDGTIPLLSQRLYVLISVMPANLVFGMQKSAFLKLNNEILMNGNMCE